MARPIKDTPILYGKGAMRLADAMKNMKPASEEEKRRGKAAYDWLKAIATFRM